jgi:hypothetical protein
VTNSVVNIHEAFGNSERLCHHCRLILDKIKSGSAKRGDGGGKFMNNLFQCQQLSLSVSEQIDWSHFLIFDNPCFCNG